MTATTSLDVAIDMVTRLRNRSLHQLTLAEQSARAAELQQQQLQSYEQETQHRWLLRARAPTGKPLLHHQYNFVDRLHTAMDLQSQVIFQHQTHVKTAQEAVRAAEQRLHGLVRYRERLQSHASAASARAEQKQWDEIALLKLGRKAHSAS